MRRDADHANLDLDEPRASLVRPVPWRATEDPKVVEELHERSGLWVRRPAWRADVLQGLAAGDDFRGLLRRFAARFPGPRHTRWADTLVRAYLFELHKSGHVLLDLPPQPVTLDGGRYHVVKALGRGSFGIAYLCEDRASGEQVVVKEPWTYFHRAEETRKSFEIEIDTLQRLVHPSIIALRRSFEEDGRLHVVREYVEGRPLGPRPGRAADEILGVAAEIARVSHFVHERGFLLLDYGPSNFLRRASDGRLVVIDVGLAAPRETEPVKLRGRTGARGYVSPEIKEHGLATVRSDVWSLGRLVFALAAGVAPSDKWDEAALRARLEGHPLAPAILRLCAEDPAARPASMAEAAGVLEEARAIAA